MIIIALIGSFMRTPFSVSIWLLADFALHIALSVIVKNNAKSRELDNGEVWAAFSFFLGLPITLIYFLMNIKLGVKPDDKMAKNKQRNALIVCVVAIIISVAVIPLYNYEEGKAALQDEYEMSEYEAFLNADGTHYVCYDKMGNEYPYDAYDIPFYTHDGVKLTSEDYLDYEIPSIGDGYDYDTNYIRYVSANGKIRIDYKNALIDEDGYMVDVEISKLEEVEIATEYESFDPYVTYDDGEGNFFYNPSDCSWDKDGNLVFKDKELQDFYNQNKK